MIPDELRQELESSLPAILNIPDICSILRVSPSTVRRELKRPGGLHGYMADEEWNVTRSDFLMYLSKNATL
jgi:IS30 family transposase